MSRHRVYLRLMEKADTDASDEVRLLAVRRAVEKIGSVEWESPPAPHLRGGFRVVFFVPQEPEYDTWFAVLDREGYMPVV